MTHEEIEFDLNKVEADVDDHVVGKLEDLLELEEVTEVTETVSNFSTKFDIAELEFGVPGDIETYDKKISSYSEAYGKISPDIGYDEIDDHLIQEEQVAVGAFVFNMAWKGLNKSISELKRLHPDWEKSGFLKTDTNGNFDMDALISEIFLGGNDLYLGNDFEFSDWLPIGDAFEGPSQLTTDLMAKSTEIIAEIKRHILPDLIHAINNQADDFPDKYKVVPAEIDEDEDGDPDTGSSGDDSDDGSSGGGTGGTGPGTGGGGTSGSSGGVVKLAPPSTVSQDLLITPANVDMSPFDRFLYNMKSDMSNGDGSKYALGALVAAPLIFFGFKVSKKWVEHSTDVRTEEGRGSKIINGLINGLGAWGLFNVAKKVFTKEVKFDDTNVQTAYASMGSMFGGVPPKVEGLGGGYEVWGEGPLVEKIGFDGAVNVEYMTSSKKAIRIGPHRGDKKAKVVEFKDGVEVELGGYMFTLSRKVKGSNEVVVLKRGEEITRERTPDVRYNPANLHRLSPSEHLEIDGMKVNAVSKDIQGITPEDKSKIPDNRKLEYFDNGAVRIVGENDKFRFFDTGKDVLYPGAYDNGKVQATAMRGNQLIHVRFTLGVDGTLVLALGIPDGVELEKKKEEKEKKDEGAKEDLSGHALLFAGETISSVTSTVPELNEKFPNAELKVTYDEEKKKFILDNDNAYVFNFESVAEFSPADLEKGIPLRDTKISGEKPEGHLYGSIEGGRLTVHWTPIQLLNPRSRLKRDTKKIKKYNPSTGMDEYTITYNESSDNFELAYGGSRTSITLSEGENDLRDVSPPLNMPSGYRLISRYEDDTIYFDLVKEGEFESYEEKKQAEKDEREKKEKEKARKEAEAAAKEAQKEENEEVAGGVSLLSKERKLGDKRVSSYVIQVPSFTAEGIARRYPVSIEDKKNPVVTIKFGEENSQEKVIKFSHMPLTWGPGIKIKSDVSGLSKDYQLKWKIVDKRLSFYRDGSDDNKGESINRLAKREKEDLTKDSGGINPFLSKPDYSVIKGGDYDGAYNKAKKAIDILFPAGAARTEYVDKLKEIKASGTSEGEKVAALSNFIYEKRKPLRISGYSCWDFNFMIHEALGLYFIKYGKKYSGNVDRKVPDGQNKNNRASAYAAQQLNSYMKIEGRNIPKPGDWIWVHSREVPDHKNNCHSCLVTSIRKAKVSDLKMKAGKVAKLDSDYNTYIIKEVSNNGKGTIQKKDRIITDDPYLIANGGRIVHSLKQKNYLLA